MKSRIILALILTVAITAGIGATTASAQEHSTYRFNEDHSTAHLYAGSAADPTSLNIGVARVSGKVDNENISRSSFAFCIYPANSDARRDGYAELFFTSDLVRLTSDGKLEVTGNLVLTQVKRTVILNPFEDYSGPLYEYGDSAVTTASFIFPGLRSGVQNGDLKVQALFGSTAVGHDYFPELLPALSAEDWPLVVKDQQCELPATPGEDYMGASCTGTPVERATNGVPPITVAEDYAGALSPAPAGNQVTISMNLELVPTTPASLTSAGTLTGIHVY